MYKRTFLRTLPFLPLTILYLAFMANWFAPGNLITPYVLVGFFDFVEMSIPTLMIAYCCFILPNKYEIELCLVCGTSSAKLFFAKAVPIFVYTLLSTFAALALYRFVPYEGSERPKIPIFVPENFRLYTAVSLFVTVFFFFALFCFFRVLTRNCYIPIFLCMFANVSFENLSKQIQKGVRPVTDSYFNPYMSNYILGDTIPNAYAEQVKGMEIMKNAWTYNRLIFFALGVILILLTYLLLRREKLHRGFGD